MTCIAALANRIDAARPIGQQVFRTVDLRLGQQFPEQSQFAAAKRQALAGSRTDRAMVLNQLPTFPVAQKFGHVAFA